MAKAKKINPRKISTVKVRSRTAKVLGALGDDFTVTLIVQELIGVNKPDFLDRVMTAYDEHGEEDDREMVKALLEEYLTPVGTAGAAEETRTTYVSGQAV